eukprot:2482438-Amphidinium_carterae.1
MGLDNSSIGVPRPGPGVHFGLCAVFTVDYFTPYGILKHTDVVRTFNDKYAGYNLRYQRRDGYATAIQTGMSWKVVLWSE